MYGLGGEAGPSVGWDSGMGSDCFPPDGDNEQLLGEFPSTGGQEEHGTVGTWQEMSI